MTFQEILFQFFQFFVGILIVNDGFSYDIRGGNDVQKKRLQNQKT
jgi:hypothetical protein